MIGTLHLDTVVNRLAELLPRSGGALGADLRKNIRAVLNQALARMDIVTREEFDVQAAVLSRTRLRLEEIEKQVAELEAALGQRGQDGGHGNG